MVTLKDVLVMVVDGTMLSTNTQITHKQGNLVYGKAFEWS